MTRAVPAVVDAVLVVVFAALGRRTHEHGLTPSGIFATAWPFLSGAAAGWVLATWLTDLGPRSVRFGLVVAAAAVVIGMGLRVVVGDGTALPFVVVAALVLTTFLAGWRWLAARVGS